MGVILNLMPFLSACKMTSAAIPQETIFFNMVALLVLMFFFRLQGLNVLMCSYRRATTGRCLPCLPFRTAAAVEPRPAGPTSDTE